MIFSNDFSASMRFVTPLQSGVLSGRSKRFFAHCLLDGIPTDAHCVNTGSMKGVLAPPQRCLLSPAANPHRKLAWTLEALEVDGVWVGVNTHRTNALAEEALHTGYVPGLEGADIRREVVIAEGRIDFVATKEGRETYIEVKHVSLAESGCARFPDSPTERGQKHLRALTRLVREGHRAVMLYVAQRPDVQRFEAAGDIDPLYAALLEDAKTAGVEVYALRTEVSPEGIRPLELLAL